MKNFETVRVFGVITVPDVRRYNENAPEFCFHALVFDIVPAASACNYIDFVERVITHQNRKNLNVVVKISVAYKVFRIVFKNKLICIKTYIVWVVCVSRIGQRRRMHIFSPFDLIKLVYAL